MRLLFLVLLILLALIQYPLWLGKGGWFNVWDSQKQITAQQEKNEGLRARNAALEAEVRDLETGVGAIEERARSELGMMREGEVFVQIVPPNSPAVNNSTPASGAGTPAPSPAATSRPAANRAAANKPASANGAAKPAAPR